MSLCRAASTASSRTNATAPAVSAAAAIAPDRDRDQHPSSLRDREDPGDDEPDQRSTDRGVRRREERGGADHDDGDDLHAATRITPEQRITMNDAAKYPPA